MKRGINYIGAGCGALLVDDNHRVLLMLRTKKCQGGMGGIWSQPGGTIEFGDTISDTIKRELKEELNVDVELFGPSFYYDDIREEDGIKKHWVTGGGFAKIIGGKLKNMEPHKCEKIEWFDVDKIPDNTAIFTKDAVEQYKEIYM